MVKCVEMMTMTTTTATTVTIATAKKVILREAVMFLKMQYVYSYHDASRGGPRL